MFFSIWLLTFANMAFSDDRPLVRPLNSDDVPIIENLKHQIISEVTRDATFPRDALPKVKVVVKGGRTIETNIGTFVAAPAIITFRGIENSYCRLVVQNRGSNETGLVPVPGKANPPTCRAMVLLSDADLNSDGLPDMVFRTKVKSNRYASEVYEYQVYLSSVSEKSVIYCFSSGASMAAFGQDVRSTSPIEDVIRSEVARRGPDILQCDTGLT